MSSSSFVLVLGANQIEDENEEEGAGTTGYFS
jgi:hypothetical protein